MSKLLKVVPLAVGALAVCALALTSASAASLADGKFLIHAYNDETPTIDAVAGSKGTATENPGGGGNETPGNFTPVTYSCGPMDFTVTKAMYDFSKSNQDLRAAGRDSEVVTNAEGWSTIYTFDGAAINEGFPTDGSKPPIVFLGTSSELNPDVMTALVSGSGNSCDLVDRRDTRPGARAGYKIDGAGVVDGRFEAHGQSVGYTEIRVDDNGTYTLNRHSEIVPTNDNKFVSETKPHSILKGANDSLTATVNLPSVRDGYDQIRVSQTVGGEGYANYYLRNGLTSANANRANAPATVVWNSDGEFLYFVYFDDEGVERTIERRETPYTLAEYNAISGQSWDGSHHEVTDFDTELPFTPTPRS